MFKLIGQLIGHSFGFAVVAIAMMFGAPATLLTIYAGLYALVPATHLFNTLLMGRTKRKATKINMTSNDYLAGFQYKASKKTQKKLDKIVVKEAKKYNSKEMEK